MGFTSLKNCAEWASVSSAFCAVRRKFDTFFNLCGKLIDSSIKHRYNK